MRILFVVPYVPTLIRVRPYNLVRYLARHGHRLTLATLWETDDERRAMAEFESLGVEVIAAPLTRNRKLLNLAMALPTAHPLQASFCWQPELAARLDSLIAARDFDAIHVEHLRGSRYALHLKRKTQNAKHKIPVVWDSVDSITHLFEQAAKQSQSAKGKLMTSFELPRTRRSEGWLAAQFDRVLVTSPTDRAALEALSPHHAPIIVLPNGVDLDYFRPCDDVPREPDALVFSGKMSYHANVTAALHLVNDIMPRVWSRKPHTRLWIVGKDPTEEVRALAMRYPERVKVTGAVPDMRAYLRQATVAVVPVVYGAGIQNKVLEAMACATPVVTSARTVASLQPGYEDAALVADGAEAFAHHVLRLLDEPHLRERLGNAGRRYVEAHHDWGVIVDRLAGIYEEAWAG
ncbi:MAG: glycosyltransferase [Anaerolineae bacterium]|nr:glycosyltransferase [Anaerolineae bacterium]